MNDNGSYYNNCYIPSGLKINYGIDFFLLFLFTFKKKIALTISNTNNSYDIYVTQIKHF